MKKLHYHLIELTNAIDIDLYRSKFDEKEVKTFLLSTAISAVFTSTKLVERATKFDGSKKILIRLESLILMKEGKFIDKQTGLKRNIFIDDSGQRRVHRY